jgi:hypothetical protein
MHRQGFVLNGQAHAPRIMFLRQSETDLVMQTEHFDSLGPEGCGRASRNDLICARDGRVKAGRVSEDVVCPLWNVEGSGIVSSLYAAAIKITEC